MSVRKRRLRKIVPYCYGFDKRCSSAFIFNTIKQLIYFIIECALLVKVCMEGKYSDPKPSINTTYSLITPVLIIFYTITINNNSIITILYFFIFLFHV